MGYDPIYLYLDRVASTPSRLIDLLKLAVPLRIELS